MAFSNWQDFFKTITFTMYRTSKIQAEYIDTIYKYAMQRVKAKKRGDNKVNILEVAGGSGYTTVVVADLLRKEDVIVYYSDLCKELVDNVRSQFGSMSNMIFCAQDSMDLAFQDNYFDIVIHQGFLEHFCDSEIICLLKEQARVSKYIIFDVPNDKRKNKFQEYGNERFLSVSKWKSLVEMAGLDVVEVLGRRFTNKWTQYVPYVLRESAWFHRTFGESTIMVCKKASYQ